MGLEGTTLVKSARKLIEISQTIKGNPSPEKEGGYLTVNFNDNNLTHTIPLGKVPNDKALMYCRLSQLKPQKLYEAWLNNPELVSSYQIRNEDFGKWGMWGGGIIFPKPSISQHYGPNTIGFSGHPEKIDEGISLISGMAAGWNHDKNFFNKVKEASNNPFLDEMLYEFNKFSENPL